MLIEISGVCQHCKSVVTVMTHNGTPLDLCGSCQKEPFALKATKGIIYVAINPHQDGVKVGMTEKTVEQRMKSLNSTGVAGSFRAVAIFPSKRPKADEKRVHKRLRRYSIAKEHFALDAIEAVLKAYRALSRRTPIFFKKEDEERFKLLLERARIEMQLRLGGNGE